MKPLGDIPGTIEDLRWTGDATALIVKAADRGLDGGATNARDPALVGRRRGTRDHQSDAAAPPLPGRRRDRVDGRDRSRGLLRLGVRPARRRRCRRGRLGGRERARLVSRQADPHRFRVAHRRPILHTSRWQLQSPAVSPVGQARRLPRRVVERSRPGRERDPHPRSRHRRGDDGRAPTKHANVTSVEWHDDESLRFAGWSKLGSIYGMVAHRRQGRLVARTKTASSAPTALPPASRPRPTRPASPPCARRSVQPPEIVFQERRRCRVEAGQRRRIATSVGSDFPATRRSRRSAGRARRARAGGPGAAAARPPVRTAADDRRNPRRPELGGKVLAQSRLRACRSPRPAMRCFSPTIAAMPAGARTSPGSTSATRRRRIRGHPRRHRPVRRRGHRRSRPPRRHRRQLWRLHDGLGGGDDRPLQGRGDGQRHRQSVELPLFLQSRFLASSSAAARSARSATGKSPSTARRSSASTSRRRRR